MPSLTNILDEYIHLPGLHAPTRGLCACMVVMFSQLLLPCADTLRMPTYTRSLHTLCATLCAMLLIS